MVAALVSTDGRLGVRAINAIGGDVQRRLKCFDGGSGRAPAQRHRPGPRRRRGIIGERSQLTEAAVEKVHVHRTATPAPGRYRRTATCCASSRR